MERRFAAAAASACFVSARLSYMGQACLERSCSAVEGRALQAAQARQRPAYVDAHGALHLRFVRHHRAPAWACGRVHVRPRALMQCFWWTRVRNSATLTQPLGVVRRRQASRRVPISSYIVYFHQCQPRGHEKLDICET